MKSRSIDGGWIWLGSCQANINVRRWYELNDFLAFMPTNVTEACIFQHSLVTLYCSLKAKGLKLIGQLSYAALEQVVVDICVGCARQPCLQSMLRWSMQNVAASY